MKTRLSNVVLLLFVAFFSVTCQSKLDPERRRIEILDSRLDRAPRLINTNGVRIRDEQPFHSTPADSKEREDEAQITRILSMLRTGTPTAIDLVTVRRSTLENNLGLQASLLAPEVASEELRAEQAKFEATLLASVKYEKTVSPEYYGSTSLDVTNTNLVVAPGIKIPLRTGGSVELDWALATHDYDAGNSNGSKYSIARPSISLEQPLLRSAGSAYNEASIELAAANYGAQKGEAQLQVIRQLISAEKAYWNLYLAWRTLEINVEHYQTARNLLDQQRELVKYREGSIADVFNFEVSLAEAVDAVLESDRDVRLAVRQVKVLMQEPDMSLDGSVALEPSTKPKLIGYEFDSKRLVAFALEHRADLLQLEYERIKANIEVIMKDNQVLPELNLQASWDFNGFDSNGLSLKSASRDLFHGNEPGGWMIGGNAVIPIGNHIRVSQYRAALLQRLEAIADVREREITVASEVLDAIDNTEIRWQQILTSRFQEQAAKRFFNAYRTLFDLGQIPSLNLTQSLQALNSSEIQAAQAQVQYQIAIAQLAQAAGCLLGHAGVEWASHLDKKRLEEPFPSPADSLPNRFENTLESGSSPPINSLSHPERRTDVTPGREDSNRP